MPIGLSNKQLSAASYGSSFIEVAATLVIRVYRGAFGMGVGAMRRAWLAM
jgi:hypothetical protein